MILLQKFSLKSGEEKKKHIKVNGRAKNKNKLKETLKNGFTRKAAALCYLMPRLIHQFINLFSLLAK
jgi:predicted DNA-binding antitoxin AbrB/MazE fold protein